MPPVHMPSLLRLALVATMGIFGAQATAAENAFVHVGRADSPGHDYLKVENSSVEECERKCAADGDCNAFTYNQLQGTCFLKLVASPVIGFYPLATTGVKLSPSMAPAGNGAGSSMVTVIQADSPGADYAQNDGASLEDCRMSCEQNEDCKAFTYNHARGVCFLKRVAQPWMSFSAWATTGIKLAKEAPAGPSTRK